MMKFYFMILSIATMAGMLVISGCKKKETYTVTFNANGGSGTMVEQTFTEGKAQALTQNAFTYDGYTFSCWNTVQDGRGNSYTDGQSLTVTTDMTLYAQWKIVPECVDLGLPSGTKWATFNVGATSPEEYGDYFAWGETVPKNYYSWGTYRYSKNGTDDDSRLTKYCSVSSYGNNGFTDALTILEASDDAAIATWGSDWRIPTYDEMNELKNSCTIIWTTLNGVNGHLFTGPNGNSIFLPVAGVRYDSSLYGAGSEGYYWTSSLRSVYPDCAWFFGFDSGGCTVGVGIGSRYAGRSVRPVCTSQN